MTRVLVNSNGKAFTTSNNRVLSSSGITPSGSISITENDTYDVTSYASAVVNVSGDGSGMVSVPYVVDNSGIFKKSTGPFTYTLPSNATDVDEHAFSEIFNSSGLTSVDLSSLTEVSGGYSFLSAFSDCSSLTSINLHNLVEITGSNAFMSAFSYCTSLTSVDLSSLTEVSGGDCFNGAFSECSSLTSISFPSLTTIGWNGLSSAFGDCTSLTSISFPLLTTVSTEGLSNAFSRCTSLTSISFPSLTTVNSRSFAYAFYDCTAMEDIYFPALTSNSFASGDESIFDGMVNGDENVTVHFPSNLQSVIGNWQSVLDGFGGNNTTILFDL